MNAKRLNLALTAVIAILALALVIGAYEINSVLTTKSAKLTSLKAKKLAADQQAISLKKAKKDIQKYAALNKIAKSVVPEDKDQAEAVREIVNIAAANNVSLSAINFPASSLGQLAPTAAVPTSSSATVKTAKPGSSARSLSQLVPVKNISGIYQLPITVVGDPNNPVQYTEFISFLNALENNRRTAQVSAITLSPDVKNHNRLTFTLTLNEYIKP